MQSWSAIGTTLHGWTLVEHGQKEEGLVRTRLSLADHRATRAEIGQTYYLGLLVDTYEKMGRTEEAVGVLTSDIAVAACVLAESMNVACPPHALREIWKENGGTSRVHDAPVRA